MGRKRRAELRGEMERILRSLDRRWIAAASRELCGQLSALFSKELTPRIEHVLAWTPFYPGEIDLSGFIAEQLGKRQVYLPRVLADRSLTFVALSDDWSTTVEKGLLGIPEPRSDAAVFDPTHAASTAVIVPGFAFDHEGNRLGRDRHSYARFFRARMMNSVKIGVCWSLQYLKEIPEDPDEVFMDWLCHERAYHNTGISFDEE